jgi:hypothetical protein
MAPQRKVQWLHRLIWVLIYGGLLTLVLGLATARANGAQALPLLLGGGVAALVGVALIGVRARMRVDAE